MGPIPEIDEWLSLSKQERDAYLDTARGTLPPGWREVEHVLPGMRILEGDVYSDGAEVLPPFWGQRLKRNDPKVYRPIRGTAAASPDGPKTEWRGYPRTGKTDPRCPTCGTEGAPSTTYPADPFYKFCEHCNLDFCMVMAWEKQAERWSPSDRPSLAEPCGAFVPPDTHHDIATIHRAILCKTCGHALGMHTSAPASKPAPAGALKAILAAAERIGILGGCYHVVDGQHFCGAPFGSLRHTAVEDAQIRGDHPFVSLSTLLSSVAELASARDMEARFQLASEGGRLRAELAEVTQQRDVARERLGQCAEAFDCKPSDVPDCLRLTIAQRDAAWTTVNELRAREAAENKAVEERDSAIATLKQANRIAVDLAMIGVTPKSINRLYHLTNIPDLRKAMPTPAESYRLLETGEIIQEGDQWQDGEGCWRNASGRALGKTPDWTDNEWRRPITGGAGLHEAATCPQDPVDDIYAEDFPQVPVETPADFAPEEGPFTFGVLARLAALEECGLLLSELPPNEARVVLASLATLFSV